MDLIVLGLNYRTAPVEVREKLDFSKFSPDDYLAKLAGKPGIRSGLVLSTCNRVEVYAAGSLENELLTSASDFLRQFHGLDEPAVRAYLYSKSNRDAVKHLFRVAASLDSMVVGEPQILGQVKEAYFDCSAVHLTDPFFDRLLQKTFSVAKKIRSETGIAEQAVSVSYAAVELAKKIFGELEGRSVLILGAGEMAELAAKHLSRQKMKRMIFANRTVEHSVELAETFGGVPIRLDQFDEYLPEADIVIVSTAAPGYLIDKTLAEKAMAARRQNPMFFIDISVPRNVDPAVNELEDVYLYNIDDLQGVVRSNLQNREQEAQKAEALVEREVELFYAAVDRLQLAPVIQSLQAKYEDVRQAELLRVRKRLAHLSNEELEEVDRALSTLVRKILNDPILFLGNGKNEQQMERADLLQRIFGMKDSEK